METSMTSKQNNHSLPINLFIKIKPIFLHLPLNHSLQLQGSLSRVSSRVLHFPLLQRREEDSSYFVRSQQALELHPIQRILFRTYLARCREEEARPHQQDSLSSRISSKMCSLCLTTHSLVHRLSPRLLPPRTNLRHHSLPLDLSPLLLLQASLPAPRMRL